MIRVDLLRRERSQSASLLSAVLQNSEVQSILLTPVLVVLAIVVILAALNVQASRMQTDLTAAQNEYRSAMDDLKNTQIQQDNYQTVVAISKRLFSLRRSVVDRAEEIIAIGNVVYRHGLRLTQISDSDDGTAGAWDLTGWSLADPGPRTTCFTSVGLSLPDFQQIANIESASAANHRDDRVSGICDYTIHLRRVAQK